MEKQGEEKTASRRRLCTPDDFARSSLLHVQEIGELAPVGPHESGRAGLASFLFLFVEEGEGTIREGGEAHPLKAGECALLDCRRGYGHAASAPWRLLWIHFDGPPASALHARWRERADGPVLRATAPERYQALWQTAWDAALASGPVGDLQANAALASLFALLAEDASSAAPDFRASRLAQVYEWIEAHYAEEVTLDRLASLAFLNKFSLAREFSARYGISPGRAVARARIARAKRLLRFTDDSVEAIGAQCGVEDPNYFARLFRRVEGVSPSAFRRQWRRPPEVARRAAKC
jgi:AraC-like DNA-binding protein